MAAGDAEIVRDVYEAFNRGELERALEMVHPEVTMYQAAEIPDSDTYRGRVDFRKGMERWLSGFEDGFQFRPERVEEIGGDRVYMEVVLRGTGLESGLPIEQRVFHLWEIRDGKPHTCWVYFDEAEARAAAGLE